MAQLEEFRIWQRSWFDSKGYFLRLRAPGVILPTPFASSRLCGQFFFKPGRYGILTPSSIFTKKCMISIGSPAPDFSLYDTTKKKISLADLKGQNVLLLFFPLAFTNTCTRELCSVRDNITMYDNADAKVFGISVDSPQTLAKFKEDQHLNFTLLSDFNKEASKAFGSIYEVFSLEMRGVSKRSAFVIDREGIVRYAEVLEDAGKVPDFAAIERTLSDLNKKLR